MKPFKCSICPAEFKTQRGLDNHAHRWICNICGVRLKTAKGYDRHMMNHKTAERRKEREENEEKQRIIDFKAKVEILKSSGLFSPVYKPGDHVILSTYHVTKPTHEQRWNRLVRVRYEEERRYYATTFTVIGVIEPDREYMVDRCLKLNEQYPVLYQAEHGKVFMESEVFESIDEAKADAKQKREKYNESCEFASMCR